MSDYPEHEKLHEVKDQSQACGQFVDWLAEEKGIHLAEWINVYDEWEDEHKQELVYARPRLTALLAEHFGIDEYKLELEKRAMLDEIRDQR